MPFSRGVTVCVYWYIQVQWQVQRLHGHMQVDGCGGMYTHDHVPSLLYRHIPMSEVVMIGPSHEARYMILHFSHGQENDILLP